MAVVPIAVTSGDVTSAALSVAVTLNGTRSYDPNGGTIVSYIWSISDKPPGSTATLTSSNTATPSFTPDIIGTYRFFLRVISSNGGQSESDESLAPTSAFSNISVPTPNKGWIIPAIGQRNWGIYLYTILMDADEFTTSEDAHVSSVNEETGDVVVDLSSVLTAGNSASGKLIKIPQIVGIPASVEDADGDDLVLQGGAGNGDGNGGNLFLKGGNSPGEGLSGNVVIENAEEFQVEAALTTVLTLEVDDYIIVSGKTNAPTTNNSLWSSDGTGDFWNQHLYWTTLSGQNINLLRPKCVYSLVTCNSSVAVGDAVYINSSGIAQKTIATNLSSSNFIGFVTEKKSATSCYVATNGEITTSGLTENTRYYLSATIGGAITDIQPTTAGTYIAAVGIAMSSTKLLIQTWPPIGN